jgi:DNA-binding response OmpR family regulator
MKGQLVGKKILVVEDNADLLDALSNFLEHHGYLVTKTNNGVKGEFHTLLANFDLLIVDIDLPEVDGISMTKFVQARIDTPVILITGLSGKDLESKLKDIKVKKLLAKPFSTDTLLSSIEEILLN